MADTSSTPQPTTEQSTRQPERTLVGQEQQVVVAEAPAAEVLLVLQSSPGRPGEDGPTRAITGLHYRIGAEGQPVREALDGVVRIPQADVPQVGGQVAACLVTVGRTADLLDPVEYEVFRSAGERPGALADETDGAAALQARWTTAPPRLYALGYRDTYRASWQSAKDEDTDRASLDFDADHPPDPVDLNWRRRLGTLPEELRVHLRREAGG